MNPKHVVAIANGEFQIMRLNEQGVYCSIGQTSFSKDAIQVVELLNGEQEKTERPDVSAVFKKVSNG